MASLINSDNGVSSGSAGLKSSADNSGVLQLQTNGTAALTVDTSQNVGIGIAPNAWSANLALQMTGPSLWGASGVSHLSTNTYFDGTNYKYIATNYVTDYYQLNGTHVWRYAASGTAGTNVTLNEAMRIDASGNVLVGTASAYANFVIKKADGTQFLVSGTTYGARVRTDASYAYVEGVDYTGSASYQPLQVGGSILSLATGGTERARIDSSGNLLVGTTSTNPIASRVNGSATASSGFLTIRAANNAAFGLSGTSGYHFAFYTDNGSTYVTAGSITSNGSATAYGVGTSDYRAKENVENYTGGLSTITSLRPVSFTWKASQEQDVGFIAHEIQAVIPSTVHGEKDAVDEEGNPKMQTIFPAPPQMIANLVAAIQEMKAIIDTQASTITQLTNRITALESK